MSNKQTSIFLDDTIQTFMYEKQALQIKLKHNIGELSNKNTYLTTVLKQLCTKQQQLVVQDCKTLKQIIAVCKDLQDDLQNIDILEKKTQILKAQVLGLSYKFNRSNKHQVQKKIVIDNQINQKV